jgi:hypothetical protein
MRFAECGGCRCAGIAFISGFPIVFFKFFVETLSFSPILTKEWRNCVVYPEIPGEPNSMENASIPRANDIIRGSAGSEGQPLVGAPPAPHRVALPELP